MTNPQSKYRTLIAIIVLLLITNIAVVAYYMLNKKHHYSDRNKGKPGFEAVLQKEVGFSDQQVAKFKALKNQYWANAKRQMEELKRVKLNLFNQTKVENPSDSFINNLADSIAILQKQIELNSFQHFKATRKICTTGQQPAYDSLIEKIITKMGRGGPNPSRGQKK